MPSGDLARSLWRFLGRVIGASSWWQRHLLLTKKDLESAQTTPAKPAVEQTLSNTHDVLLGSVLGFGA